MKVIIKEVPTPMFTKFTVFAEFNAAKLLETKTVRVQPSNVTKTRLRTTMQIGQSRFGINYTVDGIKTFESTELNYFTSKSDTKNYFVKSKKQNLDVYKEYVKSVVTKAISNLDVELDELTIELETQKF